MATPANAGLDWISNDLKELNNIDGSAHPWQGNRNRKEAEGVAMDFFIWLAEISRSTAPPGEAFSPQWWYVAMALMMPIILGVILAGLLRVLEKTFGIKLGGGGV